MSALSIGPRRTTLPSWTNALMGSSFVRAKPTKPAARRPRTRTPTTALIVFTSRRDEDGRDREQGRDEGDEEQERAVRAGRARDGDGRQADEDDEQLLVVRGQCEDLIRIEEIRVRHDDEYHEDAEGEGQEPPARDEAHHGMTSEPFDRDPKHHEKEDEAGHDHENADERRGEGRRDRGDREPQEIDRRALVPRDHVETGKEDLPTLDDEDAKDDEPHEGSADCHGLTA